VTSSTTTAAAAGHTPLSTTAGSATSSSMSGVAAPAGEPPLPSSLSTPVAVVVSTAAAATTSPAAPAVVVRQFQPVCPYNGSTSWKLFREHYRRVAKVNSWTSNEELLSHLTLALEGPAAVGGTGCQSPPGLRRDRTDRSYRSMGAFGTSLWRG